MSTLQKNIELISTIPEESRKEMNKNEILSELVESRACYERGEGEDFDTAIDEIDAKYNLK